MPSKFRTGDKVRFNHSCDPKHQVPQHIASGLRQRTRTIISVMYCSRLKRNLYELGSTGRGRLGYQFKSHQLVLVEDRHKIGRPRKLPLNHSG